MGLQISHKNCPQTYIWPKLARQKSNHNRESEGESNSSEEMLSDCSGLLLTTLKKRLNYEIRDTTHN